MKNKAAEQFYDSLENDPEAIIAWCRDEIKAYEELIKLVEKKLEAMKEGKNVA